MDEKEINHSLHIVLYGGYDITGLKSPKRGSWIADSCHSVILSQSSW